jgi:CHAD domain-containing protein
MAIAADRINKPTRKVRKLLKKLPKRPTSDQIHDLRTNARRSEATISALRLTKAKNERSMLRDLKKVRKGAGKVRDMDVLTGYSLTIRRSFTTLRIRTIRQSVCDLGNRSLASFVGPF